VKGVGKLGDSGALDLDQLLEFLDLSLIIFDPTFFA
jgi:hypothetical protein